MSRHIYIPLILIVLAVGIVAMVKAQEWSAWSTVGATEEITATEVATPNSSISSRLQSLQSQPQIFAADEPARLQPEAADSLPPRRTNDSSPRPSSIPPWVNNQFVQPADAADEVTPVRGDSIAPWQVAQVDAEATVSNQSTAIDQPASSRRTYVQDAQPTIPSQVVEAPRVAQRVERATLPVRPATTVSGNVLFQTTSPALAVRVSGPPTIVVGKAADYTIEISNPGAVDASDVSVLVDVPVWAEVSGAEATVGSARFEPIVDEVGRLKWGVFPLAAGDSQSLTLKVVPRQSRPLDLAVQFTQKPHAEVAQIDVQQPMLKMTLTGPAEVLYGETKTYTITVSNPGSGPAENVVVNLLPIAVGQDTASVSKLGNIAAGGQQVIEFDLTARQAGELEIRAAAYADSGLHSEAAQRVHVRRALLEAVAGGPQIKYAGTMAVYQFRVTNTGDAPAENVVAEAVLPHSAEFASANEGGVWHAQQSRVKWPAAPLRAGDSRVLEVHCALTEAGDNRLELFATADGELTSSAHWVTQVEALADLKLLVNDPQGPLPTGEPTVYEVRIVNRGTKAAEGVQIAGFFSEGLEPAGVEGGAAEIGVGQVIFQPIQRIVAGQELVFKITAKALVEGDHTFRADVVCKAPETKLAAQETTRFYGASVEPVATKNTPTEAKLPPLRFDQRR